MHISRLLVFNEEFPVLTPAGLLQKATAVLHVPAEILNLRSYVGSSSQLVIRKKKKSEKGKTTDRCTQHNAPTDHF
jgi:hypothetical protein